MYRKLLPNTISKFILSSYCPACDQNVKIEIAILSDGQIYRENSYLSISSDVRVEWRSDGAQIFLHKKCLTSLIPIRAIRIIHSVEGLTDQEANEMAINQSGIPFGYEHSTKKLDFDNHSLSKHIKSNSLDTKGTNTQKGRKQDFSRNQIENTIRKVGNTDLLAFLAFIYATRPTQPPEMNLLRLIVIATTIVLLTFLLIIAGRPDLIEKILSSIPIPR